jgi:hypothetical protein
MKLFITKIVCLFLALQLNGQHLHNNPKDEPATHGMLLFGQEKIYVSHLPMFGPPHNYQIIMEIELSAADKVTYLKDIVENPKTNYYTLAPEKFVLAEMVENPKPFKADIFRNHFERAGHSLILQNVTVTIKQVIYKKRFDDAPASLKTSNYLLFGNDKEQYIAHLINKRPDFDDIRSVKAVLPKGKIITEMILNDKKNTPLSSKSQNVVGKTKDGKSLSLTLGKQLYIEVDELK